MDYVLPSVYAAIGAMGLAYVASLCSPRTRAVLLTAGLYLRYGPTVAGYRPGSLTWARRRVLERNPDHARRDPAADWTDLAQPVPVQPADTAHKRRHRAYLTGDTPALGIAKVVPVLDGDALIVQHGALLVNPAGYDQLDAMTMTGEFRKAWDEDFPARLLSALNGRASAIQLEGWDAGQWHVTA